MNFLIQIWRWILWSLGWEDDLEAIQVGDRLCMPLFYVNLNGKVASTWNYLSKFPEDQRVCRDNIKAVTKADETPGICFLLSHAGEDGGIFSRFPVINQPNLDTAKEAIKELVEDGIAAFACPYTDDANPRWWEIGNHLEAWKIIHENIGPHISGYVLSIESNEYVKSIGQLQDCIEKMKQAMPGAQFYGTHLEWNAQSNVSRYKWIGGTSTPQNADMIVVELWQPQSGDSRGVQGVKILYSRIVQQEPNKKLVIQEYNFNPNGDINRQQREWLRSQEPWGVG